MLPGMVPRLVPDPHSSTFPNHVVELTLILALHRTLVSFIKFTEMKLTRLLFVYIAVLCFFSLVLAEKAEKERERNKEQLPSSVRLATPKAKKHLRVFEHFLGKAAEVAGKHGLPTDMTVECT